MRLFRIVISCALALGVAGLATGCGKKAEPPPKRDDAAVAPTVAPIATPAVGVDSIARMNFMYGAGQSAYDKVAAALRAKPRDWAAIRPLAEAVIAKDPHHLDARRVLGTALARTGEPAAAVEHLVAVLAADHHRYAPALAKDDDLKELFATPHGAAVQEVGAKIEAEYRRRAAAGLLLVARRSSFKWPKPGGEYATSRGELYAYDRETRRYLRLSHTEHQVAGFVRAPGGGEVLLLGFDKIDRPKPKEGREDAVAPAIASAWLEVIDATTWARTGKRIPLGGGREVAVGYGPGEQILVSTAPAEGRWGVGAAALASVDRSTGKLTKVTAAPPVPRVALSLEEGRVVRIPDGVTAAWEGEPPVARGLTAGGAAIAIPESGAAAQASVALSPDRAYVAFATAVDPCAKAVAPSLYVADAKTGALKHLLTSQSRFATRWLDATTLAYEDGDTAIRLWDPKRDGRGGEVLRLENKAGLALDVLSLSAGPPCKQQAPGADPAPGAGEGSGGGAGSGAGEGDEPPLPPEEPAGAATP